jgi:hypothetical protein
MPFIDAVLSPPLTADEFRGLIALDDTPEIHELLLDHPTLLPRFVHFSAISRTLRRLENTIRATQDELEMVFDDMKEDNLDDAFAFFVTRRRNERHRERPSPYRRMSHPLPSTPSARRSQESPPSYASSLPSETIPRRSTPVQRQVSPDTYFSATEEWLQYSRQPHPCTRCNSVEHRREDCPVIPCSNCGVLNHDITSCPRQGEYIQRPDGRLVTHGRQPILDEHGQQVFAERPEENTRLLRRLGRRGNTFPQ